MLNEEFYKIVDEIAKLNEDEDIPISAPDEVPVEHEESTEPSDPRAAVRQAIEPQLEVATSIIESAATAFQNKCDETKRYKQVKEQIKNWEKTLRGACQQIVAVVQAKNFVPEPTNSSPIAFKTIRECSSRDVSVLDLAAAIITFYNSLGA